MTNANEVNRVLDTDLVEVVGQTREEYPIYKFGGALETLFERLKEEKPDVLAKLQAEGKTREDNTLYAGESLTGIFKGTVPMYSSEPKENWEERMIDGKKWFYSEHFLFEDQNGKQFGVHGGASLWRLSKTATSATKPTIKDPTVKVEYIDLIVGKERLEKEFGIKITAGNKAHVAKLLMSKDAVVNEYASGVINFTRKPVPMVGKSDKVDDYTQGLRNYEASAIAGAHGDDEQARLLGNTTQNVETAQLTM